jgi:hypothetical protein
MQEEQGRITSPAFCLRDIDSEFLQTHVVYAVLQRNQTNLFFTPANVLGRFVTYIKIGAPIFSYYRPPDAI